MPKPISLCIEELDEPAERTRFIRCVALAGGEPGLSVDARGKPLWQGGSAAKRACELWVSGDERLILWRIATAPPITVRRAYRTLDVPAEKPVVVLDQDELELSGVRLRLHVHGPTVEIHPPTPFVPRSVGAVAVAAAMAFGSIAAGCHAEGGSPDPMGEAPSGTRTAAATAVGTQAPSASASAAPAMSASAPAASASVSASATAKAKPPPIEVRHRPPGPPVRPDDALLP